MPRIAEPLDYRRVFVGAGPGGSGPLVQAAGAGRLEALLERGIAVVERSTTPGSGTLGRYALNADTVAGSFLECLESESARNALGLGEFPERSELEQRRGEHVPLSLAARYLARIGEALRARLDGHARSAYLERTELLWLQEFADRVRLGLRRADGTEFELDAACASLALGARQSMHWIREATLVPGLRLGDIEGLDILPSDRLLSEGGAELARERLAGLRDPRVVVLGGSHSALSSAWLLLERLADVPFAAGSIRVLHRSRPRLFYPNAAEATADGYTEFDSDDLCVRTQRVFRMAGLRGDGRALCRRVLLAPPGEEEPRVRVDPLALLPDPADLLRRADLVIASLGYRFRSVPLLDASGQRVELAGDLGRRFVDDRCRVRRRDGSTLQRVFAMGMGSGFRPSGPALGGEPSFRGRTNGVWLYQHGIGERLLASMDEVDREPSHEVRA